MSSVKIFYFVLLFIAYLRWGDRVNRPSLERYFKVILYVIMELLTNVFLSNNRPIITLFISVTYYSSDVYFLLKGVRLHDNILNSELNTVIKLTIN